MFGTRKRKSLPSYNGSMPRGAGEPGAPVDLQWPKNGQLVRAFGAPFDPLKPTQAVFNGVIGARMIERRNPKTDLLEYFTTGGHLYSIFQDRPLFLLAETRSGKSRSHLNIIYATNSCSMFAFSPKSVETEMFANFRAKVLHQKVRIFAPFASMDGELHQYQEHGCLNPLAGVDPDDADAVIDRATRIASALVVRTGKEKESHWLDTAEAIIGGLIAHVLTDPLHANERNLVTVSRLVFNELGIEESDDFINPLEDAMTSDPSRAEGFVISMARAFFDRKGGERASVLSTTQRFMMWTLTPAMQRLLQDSDASFDELLTGEATWFVSLPISKLSAYCGYVRMMVALLLGSAEQNDIRKVHQVGGDAKRTFVVIDEMPAAVSNFPLLLDMLGYASGLGLSMLLAAQNLSQIRVKLGDAAVDDMLGHCGAITAFSINDAYTATALEKRLGQTSVIERSQSDMSYNSAISGGGSGANYRHALSPLMSAAEIMHTFRRNDPFARQLVINADTGPAITQRVAFDVHNGFTVLRDRVLHAAQGGQP